MATPALPPEKLISSTSNEEVFVCRKCKRALPLEYFQKNGTKLKTCYQCRDATQLKRRSDRKKLEVINEFLAGRVEPEDITEDILATRKPATRQPTSRQSVRSQSVPRPRHIRIANVEQSMMHTLLQLPPDIPDFNGSTDSDSSDSEDDASSSEEEIKCKPDIVTEETKPRIPELREIFEKLKIIADRGTDIISSLEKDAKTPDDGMTPSSKMSIEEATKSPYESTTCGSEKLSSSDEDDSEISGPSYFVCLHCGIPRSIGLQYDDVCVYCCVEQRFCVQGDHEAAITDFVDGDDVTHDVCSECRGTKEI